MSTITSSRCAYALCDCHPAFASTLSVEDDTVSDVLKPSHRFSSFTSDTSSDSSPSLTSSLSLLQNHLPSSRLYEPFSSIIHPQYASFRRGIFLNFATVIQLFHLLYLFPSSWMKMTMMSRHALFVSKN